jgi:hypothetical protein
VRASLNTRNWNSTANLTMLLSVPSALSFRMLEFFLHKCPRFLIISNNYSRPRLHRHVIRDCPGPFPTLYHINYPGYTGL